MDAKLLKQKKLKQLLELKKQTPAPAKTPKTGKTQAAEDSEPEIEDDRVEESLDEQEIDGRNLKEVEDMDEETPVPVLKKKHLLKHFAIKQTVESFFTGGSLHFCKSKNAVYAQRDANVVRFNLETRVVETEISHVARCLTTERRRDRELRRQPEGHSHRDIHQELDGAVHQDRRKAHRPQRQGTRDSPSASASMLWRWCSTSRVLCSSWETLVDKYRSTN